MRFDELDIDTDFAAAVAVELVAVEAECDAKGYAVRSGMVDQHAAAELVFHSYGRLRIWRTRSCTIPMTQRIIGRKIGTKVLYPLAEIAEWRVRNGTF